MPVPTSGSAPVDRPPGHVLPPVRFSGLTELRIHGVGGTPPEDLLQDSAPERVAGDRVAGFFRSADMPAHRGGSGAPERHVEAYSWGGLTSRSSWRVLWLLLLPFMLANLAGWMCSQRVRKCRVLFLLHRWAARQICLALTLNLALVTAMISIDLVGYQYVHQGVCSNQPSWWLLPLCRSPVADHPGRQLVVGTAVPLLVALALALLAARSRSRYESVRPAYQGQAPKPPPVSAATLPGGLSDPGFWDGDQSAQRLARLHIAAALALVALLLAHTTHTALHSARRETHNSPCWWVALIAAGVVLVGAVGLVGTERDWPGVVTGLRVLAVVGLASALVFAWSQPGFGAPPGGLPGMPHASAACCAAILLAFLPLVAVTVLGGRESGTFVWGAPVVVAGLAAALLNVVLLGTLVRVASLLGTITSTPAVGRNPKKGAVLYVPVLVTRSIPYLILVPVALLIAFLLVEGILWWRAGVSRTALDRVRTEYRRINERSSNPSGRTTLWYRSALDPAPPGSNAGWRVRLANAVLGRGWISQIARARRVAVVALDADKLLTLVVVAAAGAVAASLLWGWALPSPLSTFGTSLAAALPVLLIGLLRAGWGSLGKRRNLGVLWDVGTFWPRAYHPLAPPSYAEKAVPDLQRRLWWLTDNGGQILTVAHSQGTVLAASALAQPTGRPDDERVALVTFGSPLRKLYHWGFPAYFNEEFLHVLAASRVGGEPMWQNYYYKSDHIGGPICAENSPATDVYLPDPVTSCYVYGQPEPTPGGHSGYWQDTGMWDEIDAVAQKLARAEPP